LVFLSYDEPFIVQYVRRVLEHFNYAVVTATNAEQAWAIFEQRRVRISLLLTDIMMPGPPREYRVLDLIQDRLEMNPAY
jgi:CheY-like chemotaxis protein